MLQPGCILPGVKVRLEQAVEGGVGWVGGLQWLPITRLQELDTVMSIKESC